MANGITVAPCTSVDEMMEALGAIIHYFGAGTTAEDADRWSRTLSTDRMHAARENGAIVGGAGAFTYELTVPGGTVRAAGVTVVGVLPTHRRRGILSAMMRAQLDDVRRRGEPVAYLWASEETIYGRFGYGMASLCGEIDLPKAANAFVRPLETGAQTRLVDESEALEPFSQVYERIRRDYPGMFSRTEDWWKVRRLADPESRRGGGGVLNRVLLTIDGKAEGYALYRMHQTLDMGISTGFVNVIAAEGGNVEAPRGIWRFLLDIDWIRRATAGMLPSDQPLLVRVARSREMRYPEADALWVRLVDVEAALSARTIATGEPVVFDVADPFCPWNEGRYRIGQGGVERTDAPPDLSLDVNALGSVYLGGFGFGELARAGRIQELRPGSVARADSLFPRDRAPWCPEIF